MHSGPILFYSLNSLSLLVLIFILIISIKHKLSKKFLSEFMLYIIISEIINSAIIYLSFLRNSCFDESDGSQLKKICSQIGIIGNIQIYFDLFSDALTITSTLLISIKIFDSFKSTTHYFNQKGMRLIARSSVFLFSFIVAISIGLTQQLVFEDYSKNPLDGPELYQGRCLVMNCLLSRNLTFTQVIIIIALILFIAIMNLINICFVKKTAKEILNSEEEMIGNKKETLLQINKASCRLIIFIVVSITVYLFLYFDRVVKLIITDEYFQKWKYSVMASITGYCFGITNGLRGVIYSVVIIYSLTDLQKALSHCFCINGRERIPTEEVLNEVKTMSV